MFDNSRELTQPTADQAGIRNPGNLSQSLCSNHYTTKPLRLILPIVLMRLHQKRKDLPKPQFRREDFMQSGILEQRSKNNHAS